MSEDKLAEMNHHTGLTNAVIAEISSVAYFTGYCLAFGANWADKNTNLFECLFYSLLSWVNAGYVLASR